MTFAALVLAVALGVALYKLRQQRQAIDALEQAVRQRKQYLQEEIQGSLGPAWRRLCDATNSLCAELERMQEFRTSQVAQLEATLGSLQEAVLMVDDKNRILLANNALQFIFPKATNILGQRLEVVLHSREFIDYVESVRKGRAQAQHPIEFNKDGDPVWVEVTGALIAPLDGAQESWALFVLHDITKQRRLENVRKDFVANLSHELRTPLSVIKGYAETLIDSHEAMPTADRGKFLQTILRHAERLNSLLEDLLMLSRLESTNPALRRESLRPTGLINTVVEDYRGRPAAAAHRIICELDPAPAEVLVDPLRITQALENLLDNALKYTVAGSRIVITVATMEREVEIRVRDNGPGIPAEDLPHIFERFYRVDKGRSREKGGTGLGLSIVKHIVLLHGGRVWAESPPGQGTTIGFSLPRCG